MKKDQESKGNNDSFAAKWFSEEVSLITGLYHLVYDGQWRCIFASDDCFKVLNCNEADFPEALQSLAVRVAYDAPETTVGSILQEIIADPKPAAFICIRPWNNGKLQYIKGTLAVSYDEKSMLCVHGQITDISEGLLAENEKVFDIAARHSDGTLFYYDQQQEARGRADYEDETGLLRRGAGERLIKKHMADRKGDGGILCVLDLDDLKGINDTYGHTCGDKALINLAETLKSHFRKKELLIHVGGDEFMVFLPGEGPNIDSVEASLTALLQELSEIPIENGSDQTIGCSIGCAVELPETDTFDSLYQRADMALYHVKHNGKNGFAFFRPEMRQDGYRFRGEPTKLVIHNNAEEKDLIHFLEVIALHFPDIVLFDLTQDSFRVLSAGDQGEEPPAADKVEVFWQNRCGSIHPDDRANILSGMSRNSLLSLYARGKRTIRRYYRSIDPDDFVRTEIIIHFYTADDGNICAFLLFRKENVPERAKVGRLQDKRLHVSGENPAAQLFLGGRHLERKNAEAAASRRKAEQEFSAQSTMEELLVYCINTLAGVKDLDVAVDLFLQAIGSYYQADRSYIIEFGMEHQSAANTFEWCAPGVASEMANLQDIPAAVADRLLHIFETGGEIIIDSVHDELEPDDALYQILNAHSCRSLLAVPLWYGEQIVALLGLDNPGRSDGGLSLLHVISRFVMEEVEKSRLVAELEQMSYIDVLTGLSNRNRYAHVLREFEKGAFRKLGVVRLDINGMREINDTYGHEYGDEVIKRVADVLQNHFSENLFRIGGDEFVGLCTELSKEDFQDRIVMLRHAIDTEQICEVSIGCAWDSNEESVDINTLLQQAEEMRGAEKQSYYHSALSEGRTLSRISFAGEVMQEIEDDRFVVYYQPQVNLKTGKVTGAEALVRKKAEDGSTIPPGKFLPFYEMGGVISHIDLFVLRTACAALRSWNDQGHNLHISVNFSRVTLLEPYIVDVISVICAEHNVLPSSIIIEVTESIGKMDNERLKALIDRLKAAGFSISLDDFGSQYSNMAILASMDFDEVKFDRSLVSTLEDNEKARVVMKNGMELCHDLEGTVSLAEGIETKGQLELLEHYRCDYGQGYYFAKPLPLDEFERYMKENI